jgi:hypothetical protein
VFRSVLAHSCNRGFEGFISVLSDENLRGHVKEISVCATYSDQIQRSDLDAKLRSAFLGLQITHIHFDKLCMRPSCKVLYNGMGSEFGWEDLLLRRMLEAVSEVGITLRSINFTRDLPFGVEVALLGLPNKSLSHVTIHPVWDYPDVLERFQKFLSGCPCLEELQLYIRTFEMIESIKLNCLTSLVIEVREMDYDLFERILRNQNQLKRLIVTVDYTFDTNRTDGIIRRLEQEHAMLYEHCVIQRASINRGL